LLNSFSLQVKVFLSVSLTSLAVLLAGAANAAAAWSLQPEVVPAGGTGIETHKVSCAPGTTTCLAVGFYFNSGVKAAYAQRTTGGAWGYTLPANPIGGSKAELLGVSCPSSSVCFAAGRYTPSSGGTAALIEKLEWPGGGSGTWTVQSIPLPAGTTYSELGGISCADTTHCMAVGNYHDGAGMHPLVERLSGSTWTAESAPVPVGGGYPGFSGVSCVATTECVIVGDYRQGAPRFTLAEKWVGGTWTILSAFDPKGSERTLSGVSCKTVEKCTAVGSYIDLSSVKVTLAEELNGGVTWIQKATTNPGTTSNELYSVSCPVSFNECYAVGKSVSSGASTNLGEKLSGGSWATMTTATQPGTTGWLGGIDCTSTTFCEAVGIYVSAGATYPLAEVGP
jgi:hypothetical protein